MILKLMHFWRSGSMEILNFCRNKYQCFHYGRGAFLVNRLCTLTGMSKVDELPEMNESPKLPDWVQFPGGIKQDVSNIPKDDDDFVIPSLCEWIENYKLQRQEIGAEGLKKNGAVSDVDEISQTLKNPFKSPDDVLQALAVCNVDLSEGLVERVLKRFSYEWIKSYGFFKWVKLQSNFNLPPYLYNVMIDNLGKTRNFVAMWELVEEMSLLEGYITLETATTVIRRLGKAGCYEDAVEAIPRLEKFGVQKDTNMVNILINALVNGGSVERAHDVYLHEKLHISPNPSTFNMLIHGWCKTRNMEKAKRTIQDMVIHGFSPDSVSYTCLIEAHCRERDFPKVYATLDEMQRKGCPPTVVTYSIVMKALGSAKEHQKALEIYEKMKETGCLDADAYGILINILYSSGRLSDSAKVFEDMTEQGITPNLQTFNVMIRHAAKNLKEEEALRLLKKMEECQCKPDLSTYAQLLKMCCKLKRMKVLSFLMNHMHGNDVAMDIQTYALLIGGLCKIGKHQYACSLFEQSVQKGFLPTDTMYRKLVQELEKKGISEEGDRIKQLMIEAGEHNQVKKSEQ